MPFGAKSLIDELNVLSSMYVFELNVLSSMYVFELNALSSMYVFELIIELIRLKLSRQFLTQMLNFNP